jgi:hypothetical protein
MARSESAGKVQPELDYPYLSPARPVDTTGLEAEYPLIGKSSKKTIS